MRTNRRDFVKVVGMGVAGVAWAYPLRAWADRIRILGGGERGERPSPAGSEISPDFQRFLAGLRVGEMKGHGALRVFWISGGAPTAALPVATLEEARSAGTLLIVEQDRATVPELIVENRGKSHVLLLAGEILLGGKQNRVLTEDLLLPPGSGPRNIGVYCVEQGRWAGRTKDFESKGSFAAPGLRAKVMERAGQGRVWAEVDRYARSAGAPSATQSYQEIYEKREVQAYLDDVQRGLDQRAAPGALGAAVFVAGTMVGLDLFFDPGLFAREWPKLLRAQALDAYRHPRQPEPDERGLRERVEEMLRAAGKTEGTVRTNAGVGQLFEFRLEGVRGSALVFDGRIVHAAIL